MIVKVTEGRILVPGIISRGYREGVLAKVHLCEKFDCLPALQTVIADDNGVVHQRREGLDSGACSVGQGIVERERGVVRVFG